MWTRNYFLITVDVVAGEASAYCGRLTRVYHANRVLRGPIYFMQFRCTSAVNWGDSRHLETADTAFVRRELQFMLCGVYGR